MFSRPLDQDILTYFCLLAALFENKSHIKSSPSSWKTPRWGQFALHGNLKCFEGALVLLYSV